MSKRQEKIRQLLPTRNSGRYGKDPATIAKEISKIEGENVRVKAVRTALTSLQTFRLAESERGVNNAKRPVTIWYRK